MKYSIQALECDAKENEKAFSLKKDKKKQTCQ